MKKSACLLLLLCIMFALALCPRGANAMLPEVKDVVPRVGRSSKQLFWRRYKVIFADVKASENNIVKFYSEPSEESMSYSGTGENIAVTYIETSGEYYVTFSFSSTIKGRMDYVAQKHASLAVRKGWYLIRKAGVYAFGLNNSDTSIRFNNCYYLKALHGKTGSFRISRDKEGKDILRQGEFMDGVVVSGVEQSYAPLYEGGPYITFKNAELMSIDIAPAEKVKDFVKLMKAEADAREEAARQAGVTTITEVYW